MLAKCSELFLLHGANCVIGICLKDGIVRQRVVGLRRGLKLDTDREAARVQFAMAQHGHDTRRSGLFLRGKRAMFTLTAKPRTVSIKLYRTRIPPGPESQTRTHTYRRP